MKKVIGMEIQKAFQNRWFVIAFLVLLFLAGYSAAIMVTNYLHTSTVTWEMLKDSSGALIKNPHMNTETLFNSWIGGEFSTWCTSAFFFLLPLLAALPYGGSLATEMKSGYIKNMFTRIGRGKYLTTKYLAAFLSGGTVIAVPLLLNWLAVACFIPMRMPEACEFIYYGIYPNDLWSGLFYASPVLYDLLFIGLNFIFAGLWSMLSLSMAFFVKGKAAAILAPYMALLCLHFLTSNLLIWDIKTELSPISYLRALGISHPVNGWIVLAQLLLLLFSATFVIRKGEIRDVF